MTFLLVFHRNAWLFLPPHWAPFCFLILFLFLILERRERLEKERERNIDMRENSNWLPSVRDLTREQTFNRAIYPDRELNPQPNWESNRKPPGLQDDAQPTEPHRPERDPVLTAHFSHWAANCKCGEWCFLHAGERQDRFLNGCHLEQRPKIVQTPLLPGCEQSFAFPSACEKNTSLPLRSNITLTWLKGR